MVSGLETQKSEMAKRFDKELESQKDRARILEERFKAASGSKVAVRAINPMDLD